MFQEGQYIPCPGGSDEADRAMYVLLTGMVDVYKESAAGGKQSVGTLLPGDVFGGREYFADAVDCTYRAALDSAVFVINKASFSELSWSQPEVLFEIFRASYKPLKKIPTSEIAKIIRSKDENATVNDKPPPKPAQPEGAQLRAQVQAQVLARAQEAMKSSSVNGGSGIFPQGHKPYPGVTQPEFLKLVFSKEYKCPLCSQTFSDYKIFSSKLYEARPMRYDLRRFYTGFKSEWYEVITCSNCLFSMFGNYFTDPKPLQKAKFEDNLVGARSTIHMDFSEERNLDFVFTSHYLALLCADGYLSSINRQIKAKLWGNLSWLYEDAEDAEMMKFAALNAAEQYEAIYSQTPLTTVQEQITCLSIAGMQHRAGVDRNLKKYLFSAKTSKQGDKSYAKIAEDFMYDLRLNEA